MPPMKRPPRDPSSALEYCRNNLAGPDGSPSPSLPKVQPHRGRFDPDAPPKRDVQGTERLREWLNRITELAPQKLSGFDAATAYLALLQSWLALNDVSWPNKGVFTADLRSGGKGRPRDVTEARKREQCFKLRKERKPLKEIAAEVFPECTTPSQKARARRKAKDYAKSYSARKYRPDLYELSEEVRELLGIEDPSIEELL